MGQAKKRKPETLDEVLQRPWCYYCDRDFDDRKVLVDHQKAKHFHCTVSNCHRRLNTAGGLKVHMQQVHKEELTKVPNALANREEVTPEIFGMEGVPQELIDQRTAYITRLRMKEEAEWRAKTGNPLSGSTNVEQPAKKQKVETKEDIKARVAAIKAAKAAEKAARAAGQTPPSQGTPGVNGAGTPQTHPSAPGTIATPPSVGYDGYPPGLPFADPRPMATPGYPPGTVATPLGVIQPYGAPSNGLPPFPQPIGAPPTGHFPTPNAAIVTHQTAPGTTGTSTLSSPPPLTSTEVKQHPSPPVSVETPLQAKLSTDETTGNGHQKVKRAKEKKVAADDLTKMIFSDNVTSPEEKRARSARYQPKPKADTMPTSTATQAHTGPVNDSETG